MLSGSNCVVAFTTLAGLSYDVQRIGEAGGGNWSLVSTGIAGNGGTVQTTDTNAASEARRFYRIKLSP